MKVQLMITEDLYDSLKEACKRYPHCFVLEGSLVPVDEASDVFFVTVEVVDSAALFYVGCSLGAVRSRSFSNILVDAE